MNREVAIKIGSRRKENWLQKERKLVAEGKTREGGATGFRTGGRRVRQNDCLRFSLFSCEEITMVR